MIVSQFTTLTGKVDQQPNVLKTSRDQRFVSFRGKSWEIQTDPDGSGGKIKGFEARRLGPHTAPMKKSSIAFRSYALGAVQVQHSSGVRGQEGVTSEVFIMTLARISWVWLSTGDPRS